MPSIEPVARIPADRELLVHALYEAAELEHNLMCTYLYAAFSLKGPGEGGLSDPEAAAVGRWRQAILAVAVEEMGHLAAVWNITTALGAAPRIGRTNFPLDPGFLPASVTVKLAPFNAATLQHFIFLERPHDSVEPEGAGFATDRPFVRTGTSLRLIPTGLDYATVGEFYSTLKQSLIDFAAAVGEDAAFCGDPALQFSGADWGFADARPVRCLGTALNALDAIVRQGEGSPSAHADSHFERFTAIRRDYGELLAANPAFVPAFPAATNPVLRRPPRPEGRVWIEDPAAVAAVDLANACYSLMLRLLAYAWSLPATDPDKARALALGVDLMHAMVYAADHAARLPAGASNPDCHAGMSFTALRDSAALPPGRGARAFFTERLATLASAAHALAGDEQLRLTRASALLGELAERAEAHWPRPSREARAAAPPAAPAAAPAAAVAPPVEVVAGAAIEIQFETKRCIHARFCVTGAPSVFLANVQGPWIHPDTMPVERLVEVAHACPSGAIRYRRLDGHADETAPPVNLLATREAGPYAVRAEIYLDGKPAGYRATLCRCGASKNKPYCDGSHHAVEFSATGEPPSGTTDMLATRNGRLSINPLHNGPLSVEGNLEITSGTGRVVSRLTAARLCRCGGSQNKPFCDGTHARIGFTSD